MYFRGILGKFKIQLINGINYLLEFYVFDKERGTNEKTVRGKLNFNPKEDGVSKPASLAVLSVLLLFIN